MVREVSPDLHLITPELHQVSPDFFFKKWENAKCKNGKMQNAVLFSCRLKVSTELGISPAGCFSLQIAERHFLGFRLKKKANGNPMYAWIYFRKNVLTCTNLNCQSAIGEQRCCYRLVGCIYKRGPPICAFACERSTVFGRFGSPEQEILHGP